VNPLIPVVVVLGLVVLGQTLALVRLTLSRPDEQAARLRAEHDFALATIAASKATTASEAVVAEAQREDFALEREAIRQQTNPDANAPGFTEHIRKQNGLGYFGDVADGRAAMVLAGWDPDDAEQSTNWNAIHAPGSM